MKTLILLKQFLRDSDPLLMTLKGLYKDRLLYNRIFFERESRELFEFEHSTQRVKTLFERKIKELEQEKAMTDLK